LQMNILPVILVGIMLTASEPVVGYILDKFEGK